MLMSNGVITPRPTGSANFPSPFLIRESSRFKRVAWKLREGREGGGVNAIPQRGKWTAGRGGEGRVEFGIPWLAPPNCYGPRTRGINN